jgi:hypothetical protein
MNVWNVKATNYVFKWKLFWGGDSHKVTEATLLEEQN